MQRSDSMPSQSKAGPCVAMHLIIGMAVVMLLAVIATSISLVTLTSHSRIVLYQTVNIEKGDAQQSASQGCAGNSRPGAKCEDVQVQSTSIEDLHKQEQKALQISLEAEYDGQRAHQADAGAATEAGHDIGASSGSGDPQTDGSQQLTTGDLSDWNSGASVVVSSSGVGGQHQLPGNWGGSSLSYATAQSTANAAVHLSQELQSTSAGSGMPRMQHVVVPRLLREHRSTVLGALPGSDPGVDGSDGDGEQKVLEDVELEEFAEQPKQVSQEMIDALVCCRRRTFLHNRKESNPGTCMQNLGFKMHVPNSLTYSDMTFCPGAEEPPVEQLAQLPSNKRALFIMSSNAYAKKQIATALSKHPAFRVPTKSLLPAANQGKEPPLEVHYFNKWPLPPVQQLLDCFPHEQPSAAQAEDGSAGHAVVADTAHEALTQLAASGGSLVSRIAARSHGSDSSNSNSNSNSKADSTEDVITIGGLTSSLRTATRSWVTSSTAHSASTSTSVAASGTDDVTVSQQEDDAHDEEATDEQSGVVGNRDSGQGGVGGDRRLQGGKGAGKRKPWLETPGAMKEPILLDSTFDYWANAAVPPRMQAIVPQARFVVLLQDPTARAFEQFQALHRGAAKCKATHPRNPDVCPKPPLFERAVVNEAATGGTQRGCFFDTPGANMTWGDCFACAYTNIDFSHCQDLSPENQQLFLPCRKQAPESTSLLQIGNYAPALGWWLSFFSPERFLIIPVSDLRTHNAMQKAISRILDHIGADPAAMPDHTAVTPGVPSRVSYMPVTWLQQQAMHLLRSRYQVSEGDLSAMIDLVLPGDGQPFMGMRPETSTGDDELTM